VVIAAQVRAEDRGPAHLGGLIATEAHRAQLSVPGMRAAVAVELAVVLLPPLKSGEPGEVAAPPSRDGPGDARFPTWRGPADPARLVKAAERE
jgi:hypothetical protein